jgi:hypothetical protein
LSRRSPDEIVTIDYSIDYRLIDVAIDYSIDYRLIDVTTGLKVRDRPDENEGRFGVEIWNDIKEDQEAFWSTHAHEFI